jgi:hypothetical protein
VRNRILYKNLRDKYSICILPDKRIQRIERLPHFSIIEGSFVEDDMESKRRKKQRDEVSRGEFDAKYFKSNIDFFEHLNKKYGIKRFRP